VTLVTLALFAIVMAIAAHCRADGERLIDRLVTVQPALQSRQDEPVDARELAEAIAAIPRVNASWAALVLTIAAHESALSARIARGECRRNECDGGRASGLYQSHRNKLNAAAWGSTDIRVQTLEAARALRSAFYTCKASAGPDWVRLTINGYAGKRCDAQWPGLDQRLATYERIRGRL
jgi:hypothetical protein